MVFLDAGRVVESGPPGQILDAPDNPRVRDFMRKSCGTDGVRGAWPTRNSRAGFSATMRPQLLLVEPRVASSSRNSRNPSTGRRQQRDAAVAGTMARAGVAARMPATVSSIVDAGLRCASASTWVSPTVARG